MLVTETFLVKVVAVRITRLVFGYNFVVHHFVREWLQIRFTKHGTIRQRNWAKKTKVGVEGSKR